MSSPPTKYIKSFDYAANPTLNVDFDRLKVTTDQTIDRLALLQRDDGGLRDSIITADGIANGAITTPKLADYAVTNIKLGTGAVDTRTILARAVENAQIGDSAVDNRTLLNGSVDGYKLTALCISTGNLQDLCVTTPKIADASITTAKLAPGAILPGLLPDNSIPTAKLQDLSVTTPKIADGAVTNAKLGASSISSDKIQDGTIAPTDLSAASIALITSAGNPRGAWLTGTAYATKDAVTNGPGVYVCITAHVAGVFATDLAAGKWYQTGTIYDQSLNTTDIVRFAGLGIGSPLPAFDASVNALSIGPNASLSSTKAAVGFFLQSNSYQDGPASTRYRTNGPASLWVMGGVPLQIFDGGPDGVAGAAVTWKELLRLDRAGNLGLGRTPEAWDASNRALAVGGALTLNSSVSAGAGNGTVTVNSYYDGANHRYITANGASLLYLANSAFEFHSAPAGAAGAIATYTLKLTLDANGNVGMGMLPGANMLAMRRDQNSSTSLYMQNSSNGASAGTTLIFSNGGTLCRYGILGASFNIGLPLYPAGNAALTSERGITYDTAASQPHLFGVNGGEKMRIDVNGIISGAKFQCADDTANGSYGIGSFGSYLGRIGAGGHVMLFGSQNNIYVQAQSGGVVLGPGGTAWGSNSSRAIKKDIQPIPGDVFAIIAGHETALFHYDFDDADRPLRPGLFYEDAKELYPWAALTMPGTKAIYMDHYVPLLMAAFKKQIEINAAMQARLDAIQGVERWN